MASDRRIRDFRCFTFKGRMRRKPFWFWLLPYFLTCCVLGALLALTFIAADSSAALSIFLLIVFFAGLVGTVIAENQRFEKNHLFPSDIVNTRLYNHI